MLKKGVENQMSENALVEKMEQLKKEIQEFNENKEDNQFEELLRVHRMSKDFEQENFTAAEAQRKYFAQNDKVVGFILSNTSKLGKDSKTKVWRHSKFSLGKIGA